MTTPFAEGERAATYDPHDETISVEQLRAQRRQQLEVLRGGLTLADESLIVEDAPAAPVAPTSAEHDAPEITLPPMPAPVAVDVVPESQAAVQPAPPAPAHVAPTLDDFRLDVEDAVVETGAATTGVRGVLSKIGIKLAPSAAEQAERARVAELAAAEARIRQSSWTRAAGILVANKKGGVGKTPLTLMLAGVIATIRGGSVAAVEVSDDPGALTYRSEGRPVRGVADLARDAQAITSAGQLGGYAVAQTSYASVIGSPVDRARLDRDDVVNVCNVVDSYYRLRILDSGNQPSSSAFDGAIECSDVLVIPTLNSGDSVLEGLTMLEGLRAAGGRRKELADRAILVRLTDGRPEHTGVLQRLNRLIEQSGFVAVYDIPYDPHIAERHEITLDKLAPQTRAAVTLAAAGVIDVLNQTVA